MDIRNKSTVEGNDALLRAIAAALDLGGALPAATRDEVGVFEAEDLQVIIRPLSPDRSSGAGHYTCGEIEIRTCPYCTAGRIVWVFLHESAHAWLDSYAPDYRFGPRTEAFADAFADSAFERLGGTIGDHDKCATYELGAARLSAVPSLKSLLFAAGREAGFPIGSSAG